MVGKITDYRNAQLAMLSRLDRLSTEAKQLLAAPGDVEIGAMAEELRELLVDLQAKLEEKLDECSSA
jgi:hypothetical protein